MQERSKVGIPFDGARHVLNARGRWYDTVGKRYVRIDPASLPEAKAPAAAPAAPAAAPAAQGPARDLEGVPMPEALPVAAAEAAAPAADPAAAGAASAADPGPSVAGVIDLDAEASQGSVPQSGADLVPHDLEHPAHIDGCWKGRAEGRMCSCGVRVFDPMPDDEAYAAVAMHEMIVNRFVPYPRDYSERERKGVADALILFSRRYGNPLAKYAPHLALIGGTAMIAIDRQSPQRGADGSPQAPQAPQAAPVAASGIG